MGMNQTVEHDNAKAAALPHVQEVLRSAQRELAGLLRQREELMKRIGSIKQVLAAMSDLFGESVLNEELRIMLQGQRPKGTGGFTLACRQVLMRSRAPLSLRRCSEELRQAFPELADRHKDLTASVGTVLRRLATYGEASFRLDEKGNRLWEWIAKSEEDADRIKLSSLDVTLQPPQPAAVR
jgi:ParB-like chromosome segregation protein Spo0J